jgi:hypothetical protein
LRPRIDLAPHAALRLFAWTKRPTAAPGIVPHAGRQTADQCRKSPPPRSVRQIANVHDEPMVVEQVGRFSPISGISGQAWPVSWTESGKAQAGSTKSVRFG